MDREMPESVARLVVGAVVQGNHGTWTILGAPVYSHPSPGDARTVYKVPVYWEGNDGSHRAVTLTVE